MKKAVKSNTTRAKRKLKTKRGIDRRIPHIKHPPKRRALRHKRTTGKQKIAAKQYRLRRKNRLTPLDKKIDKARAKHLREIKKTKTAQSKSPTKPISAQTQTLPVPVTAEKSAKIKRPTKPTKPTKPAKVTESIYNTPVPSTTLSSTNKPTAGSSVHSLLTKALKINKKRYP
jgi:hypothetical protein